MRRGDGNKYCLSMAFGARADGEYSAGIGVQMRLRTAISVVMSCSLFRRGESISNAHLWRRFAAGSASIAIYLGFF